MSDVQQGIESQAPEAPSSAPEVIPSSGDGNLSAREAANSLVDYRHKRDAGERRAQREERREEAPPTDTDQEHSPSQEPNVPEREFETEEAQPEESAIEPPRSWSKEEKERFTQLPRETQEYLTRRETERDTALRRGQNEAAQTRQTLEIERAALDTARKQYEAVLPALLQQLQQQQMGEFADIRTQADVDNMARNDWQRFALWQNHRMKMDALNQQVVQHQQQQQQEYVQRWNQFATAEDVKFAAQATEMHNPDEAHRIATAAVTLLRDTGFTDDDLNKLWSGQASVSLRDHRMQLIIRDAARYRQAKASAPTRKAALPASKTLRPGTPAERASDKQVELSSLDKRLNESGKWRDAADLLIARRSGRR